MSSIVNDPSIASIDTISWNQISQIQEIPKLFQANNISEIAPLPTESTRPANLSDRRITILKSRLNKLQRTVDDYARRSFFQIVCDFFTGTLFNYWRIKGSLASVVTKVNAIASKIIPIETPFTLEVPNDLPEEIAKKLRLVKQAYILVTETVDSYAVTNTGRFPANIAACMKVQKIFRSMIKKLQNGCDIPIPRWYHATGGLWHGTGDRTQPLKSILNSRTITQSASGAAGRGLYVSNNDEGGTHGYGFVTFAIDEEIFKKTNAVYFCPSFRSIDAQNELVHSLWVAVHKDVPVSSDTIAYLSTEKADLETVKSIVASNGLRLRVIERSVSELVRNYLDLADSRRNLPSSTWYARDYQVNMPENMVHNTQTRKPAWVY